MYTLGDRVVYGIHGVCCVVAVEQRRVDRKQIEYFALEPIDQPGSRYYVPTQNQAALAKLRPLLSKEEMDALLSSDQVRQECWIPDEGQRKLRYRELLSSGDRAELLSMLGCVYRHKEQQVVQGRKFHLCDENFLRDARKVLDSEIALVMEIKPAEVEAYIRNRLEVL